MSVVSEHRHKFPHDAGVENTEKCFLFFEKQLTLESVYRFGSLNTHVIHVYFGSWFSVVYPKQTAIVDWLLSVG